MAETVNIQGKRFLPRVADAIFKVDGEVAFIAKSNTSSSVNITTESSQIRGGTNNAVIGVVTSDTTVEVSFTAVDWQPEYLAANVGSTIQIGSWNFTSSDLQLTAGAEGVVTLPALPSDKKLHVEISGGWVTVPTTTTSVNLSDYGVKEGDCVKCLALFEQKGIKIELSVESVPYTGELTLTSPMFEGSKGKIGVSEYVFPAFQLSGSFNHAYQSDANYEISGSPVAVDSVVCGGEQSYGYYQEYATDDKLIDNVSSIRISPSTVELDLSDKDTETLKVYGLKSVLYEGTLLDNAKDITFASESASIATVSSAGVITPVSAGTTTVTATYKDSFTDTVAVTVVD